MKYAGKEAMGNLRRRGNTLAAPNVRLNEADPTKLYTIVIWDPDAPREPSFLHWLVTNIPGGDVARGTVVQKYYPPTPPDKEHRYYVGLYEQSGRLGIKKVSQTGFDIDAFVSRHALIQKGLKMVKVRPGY